MDINHFLSRQGVTRNVPPIGFVDDDLSVITCQNQLKTIRSQVGLKVNSPHDVLRERMIKKRIESRLYYELNQELIKEKARNRYHNTPDKKAKKAVQQRRWRAKNLERSRELSRNWIKKNRDKVNQGHKQYYLNRISKMTELERKQWMAKKNKEQTERQIKIIGHDAFREKERNRLKEWRDNLPPEKLAIQREKARIRMQQTRDKKRNEKKSG